METIFSNVGNLFYTGVTSDITKSITIKEIRIVSPTCNISTVFNDDSFIITPAQYVNYGITL